VGRRIPEGCAIKGGSIPRLLPPRTRPGSMMDFVIRNRTRLAPRAESSLCADGGGGKEKPAGTGEDRLQVVMLFNSRGRKRPSAFRETGIVSDNGPAGSEYNVSQIV